MKDYILIDKKKLVELLERASDWDARDTDYLERMLDQATVPAKPKEHSVECKKYKTICTCDYFNKPEPKECLHDWVPEVVGKRCWKCKETDSQEECEHEDIQIRDGAKGRVVTCPDCGRSNIKSQEEWEVPNYLDKLDPDYQDLKIDEIIDSLAKLRNRLKKKMG